MVVLSLVFCEPSMLFSVVNTPVYIPSNSAEEFLFFTSSLTFIVCDLFDTSHSDRCEVVPHCGFDLQFPIN